MPITTLVLLTQSGIYHTQVHYHIMSLWGEVWSHKTCFIPPLFMEVSASVKWGDHVLMLRVLIVSLSMLFLLNFGAVPTVWYILFFSFLLMRDLYPFQLWDGLELWRSTNKCYVCNKIRLIPIIQWLIDCLICVYILTLSIMQQLPLDKVISNRIIWIQIPVLTTRRSLKIKIKIKISNVLRTTLTETTIHTYNNGDISLHFTHYSAVIVLTP